MTLVNRIPVDQSQPAGATVKRYLLKKIQEIRRARETIEAETVRNQKDKILEAYKKSVGFAAIKKRLEKAEREEDEARSDMMAVGLNEHGNLISIGQNGAYTDPKTYRTSYLSQDQIKKIQQVQDLMEAVRRQVEVFTPMDQLETRMMLAANVGEAMAIVNAVAGKDVFKIDVGQLKLGG